MHLLIEAVDSRVGVTLVQIRVESILRIGFVDS